MPKIKEIFYELDEDGSGALDRAEVVAGASQLLINEQQAAELFDKLDLDGNGNLSLEELTDLDPKGPAGRAQTAFAGTEHKKRRSLLTSAGRISKCEVNAKIL